MSEQQADYTAETDEAMQMLGAGYEPREILSVLSGFTPAPDVLIKKYGFITALIWGRVWRYCQMADNMCRAKIKKIADELGMSERTIIRHLETLCADGFLLDKTPDLRNRPHIYLDTGKIRIRISIDAGMSQSHSGMSQSHSGYDRESVEESIKKQPKKEKIKERGASATPKATEIPEVVLFRSVTGRYPSKDTFRVVVESIQKISARLGRDTSCDDLLPFWEAWRVKGFKSVNLSWLTDWAVAGKITQNGNGKNKPSEPKGFEGIRQFMEAQNG